MRRIPFYRPVITGKEQKYFEEVLVSGLLSGDHVFTRKCTDYFERKTGAQKVFLTTSATHALEMAALLIDLKPGDEVIMPSYTFTSTANAFILRGARAVFVDIRPDTMNMNEELIEAAITRATKAIVPVHYAGVACEMNRILKIAGRHNLFVIEDAAQGMLASYREKPLGTLGHLGVYSFHESKNFTCGEGGALFVNDARFNKRAEIIREKGTNRAEYFRGEVNKYDWKDVGSSYLLGDLNAAFLYAQLEVAGKIHNARLKVWNRYRELLTPLKDSAGIELPEIPRSCGHNGHIFYIKTKGVEDRSQLISHLKSNGIPAYFHYLPLHTSGAGMKYGRFVGTDAYTTKESERLLRLPLYVGMTSQETARVCAAIRTFYNRRGQLCHTPVKRSVTVSRGI